MQLANEELVVEADSRRVANGAASMRAEERVPYHHFALPLQQAFMMLLVIALVIAGSYLAYNSVAPIILANVYLNGFIIGVFGIGILACFWQVIQIFSSVLWIQRFLTQAHRGESGFVAGKPPRLLAPLAGMLGSRSNFTQISATSSRTILDTVASRLDEARDISRYLSNLLIFLGLLGTFFGLAITVPAVVETIRSLAPTSEEGSLEVFSRLMLGLEEQLGGMGTAFSSSLLGLAGSLVIGLLDLLAGHGQNRFYRELEEWISGITKVGFGQSLVDAEGGDQPLSETAIASLLEHLSVLHEMLEKSEQERNYVIQSMAELTEAVSSLAARVERQTEIQEERYRSGPPTNELLDQIAASQSYIGELIGKLAVDFSDEETRTLLRNIDIQLLRISEDNLVARQDAIQQIRAEINSLGTVLRGQSTHRTPRRQGRQEGLDPYGSGE